MTKFLNISVDNTLGGNSPSDEIVSSQKAVKEYIDSQGGGLPSQTGNAGKFLTTDGTDASWSDKPLVNATTWANALTILGTAANAGQGTNIGYSSKTNATGTALGYSAEAGSEGSAVGAGTRGTGFRSVAIGRESNTNYKQYSVCIGYKAKANANNSAQINLSSSEQTNSDANTFKVANANGNFELMSADGTIPEARLADTTGASQGDVLTLDANGDAVWQAGGGGSVSIDNITITTNADDEIQTVAMIDQNSGIDKIWTGESADYEDIANPSNDTFYAITDDIGDSALDIGQITETLNDKVDKGHEVIEFQAPTVINGYTWYRKYADGWVEQGGIITNPAETNYTIPVEMADTNYTVFITDRTQSRVSSNAGTPTSTTQFYLSTNGTGSSYSKNWEVKGMAA